MVIFGNNFNKDGENEDIFIKFQDGKIENEPITVETFLKIQELIEENKFIELIKYIPFCLYCNINVKPFLRYIKNLEDFDKFERIMEKLLNNEVKVRWDFYKKMVSGSNINLFRNSKFFEK
jgi:hypothetical protein